MESNLKRKEENLLDLSTNFSNNSVQKGFSSVHEKKKRKKEEEEEERKEEAG